MIKSFFKIAFRHLTRSKPHSFINIFGLSTGMAGAILIGLWISDECSYERYNPRYDHIAQVMQTGTLNGESYTYASMPLPLATELRTTYSVMPWWLFVAAGAGLLFITLLTVSFQAPKAALANPVRSLKTE